MTETLEAPRIRQPWTDAENAAIREHYPTHGAKRVAERLGRTTRAVSMQATKLGVRCTVSVQYIGHIPAIPAPRPKPAPAPRRPMNGPFYADAEVEYSPKLKVTRAPTPPNPTRSNTHGKL